MSLDRASCHCNASFCPEATFLLLNLNSCHWIVAHSIGPILGDPGAVSGGGEKSKHGRKKIRAKKSQERGEEPLGTIGAVTHITVNGFSHGKFSRGTSHLGFSFPWFQRLHAKCDFPGKTNATRMKSAKKHCLYVLLSNGAPWLALLPRVSKHPSSLPR